MQTTSPNLDDAALTELLPAWPAILRAIVGPGPMVPDEGNGGASFADVSVRCPTADAQAFAILNTAGAVRFGPVNAGFTRTQTGVFLTPHGIELLLKHETAKRPHVSADKQKAAEISALILSRVRQGESVEEAVDVVLGVGTFAHVAGAVWEALRYRQAK